MENDLLLISGADIPFAAAGLTIHVPRIKEIAYIGEKNFFSGCELLKFSKSNLILSSQDKDNLENQTDFDIIMSIINDKTNNAQLKESVLSAIMVLSLIFPNYKIKIDKQKIILTEEGEDNEHIIDNNNYQIFRDILISMFCLTNKKTEQDNYNPGGPLASKIAEKLKRGKAKVAQQKGDNTKISVLSKFASILSVGEGKDLNSLMNYTVYQLFDEFERYNLKNNYDIYIKSKFAGATGMDEPDNWMIDIHKK